MKKLPQLIIVEDNPMYLEVLVQHFRKEKKYEVLPFLSAEACLQEINDPPAGYLLDQDLDPEKDKGMTGLQLLSVLKHQGFEAPALFLTGHEAVQPAAAIMKGGAFDYMRKEYSDLGMVSEKIMQMIEWNRLHQGANLLQEKAGELRKRTLLFLGLTVAVLTTISLL